MHVKDGRSNVSYKLSFVFMKFGACGMVHWVFGRVHLVFVEGVFSMCVNRLGI